MRPRRGRGEWGLLNETLGGRGVFVDLDDDADVLCVEVAGLGRFRRKRCGPRLFRLRDEPELLDLGVLSKHPLEVDRPVSGAAI